MDVRQIIAGVERVSYRIPENTVRAAIRVLGFSNRVFRLLDGLGCIGSVL